MKLTVSVVVPVYNVEDYLEDCLDSIVKQTVSFDEIILINDGSTDGSRLICEKYCKEYPFIRLINQVNKGPGAARNLGIEQAIGDYIVFADSDDYIDLRLCERIKEIIRSKDLDVIYYNAKIQYDIKTEETANAFWHPDNLNGCIMTGMEYFDFSFPGNYNVSAWGAVYRKHFLKKSNISFPEGIYYEDHYFMLQVISNAEKVLCIPDCLYIRRCRENSITTGKFDKKRCCDIVTNQKIMWGYVSVNCHWFSRPDLLRSFSAQMLLNAFYNISKCSDKCIVDEQKEILTRGFLKKCLSLFLESEYRWSESLPFILVLLEVEKIDGSSGENHLIENFFGTVDRFRACLERAVSVLERDFIEKLSKILMDKDEAKVGIYGTGRHTMELIKLYRQYFGEIKCELFFIVTACEKGMSFYNRPVISCCDIPEDIEHIVLSSLPYQGEMRENLVRQGIHEKKIVSLYEKDDICDLIMVNWVLSQLEVKKDEVDND